VTTHPEITQRDLRTRSREIMDHRIGELIPLRHRRRFVSRQEFADMSRNAPAIDPSAFRADQDAAQDYQAADPYEPL
jgi:hypothetical protein